MLSFSAFLQANVIGNDECIIEKVVQEDSLIPVTDVKAMDHPFLEYDQTIVPFETICFSISNELLGQLEEIRKNIPYISILSNNSNLIRQAMNGTKYLQYVEEKKEGYIETVDELFFWLGVSDQVVLLMPSKQARIGAHVNKGLKEKGLNVVWRSIGHKVTGKFIGYEFRLKSKA